MNLQLFAWSHNVQILKDDGGGGGKKKEEKKTPTTNKVGGVDPNSIVDYLKMNGEDSSYSARAVLADELGIANYKGSGEQNTLMLKMLKNGTAPATNKPKATDKPKADNTPAPAVTPAETTPAFTQSADATAKQKEKDEALNALTGMTEPSINPEYMQVLNTPYTMSSAVQDAWNVTNAMKEKLLSGRTSYTDQIQSLINQIQNRDKFSYDVDTDMLFQQALASAMGSGQQAMQNTIGQASALTGGYASTYATSAGNQAYNAYIQDAYNNLPEYYQMALEAYNMEGQDMYNQLAMLNDADATEYGRMYDAWNTSHTEWQDLYNQDYSAWRDNWNNNYNMAKIDLDQQGMAYDQAYNNYNVLANDYNTMRNNEFDSWTVGLDTEQANLDRDQKYNMWLAENDLNGDKVVDEKDYAVSKSYSSSNASSNESGGAPKIETLTNREMETFVNIVMSADNDEAGFEAGRDYLASIGKSETDFAQLDFALEEAKAKREKEKANLPVWETEWNMTEDGDTKNKGFLWWKGVDHDDVFTDGYREYTYDELKEMLDDSELTERQKEEFLKKLSDQSKN